MTQAPPKPTDIKPPFTLETALAKVRAAENGLMQKRFASINNVPIQKSERRIF